MAVSNANIFAGTNNGLYRSTNDGLNWTVISISEWVYAILIIDSNIFAGAYYGGVYFSSNNGLNWVQKNEGFGNQVVNSLLSSNNYIYAGTAGSSVWKRPLSELIGINPIAKEVPDKFSLFQNYPNPFNPTTKIKFQIAKSSFVTLKIYDILGREVETLVNEKQTAGTYQAEWDGSIFASGIYFYKLQTESFSETKKMMLIR